MDFTCDKAISLNGFVICYEIDVVNSIQVKIAGDTRNTDFTKSTLDNDETRKIFDNPIHVAAGQMCRIDIKSESKENHGFEIEKIVHQNGVSFQFGAAHKYYNSLTRLLYSNIG